MRPFYSDETLARIYARPFDHTRWPDHVERVAETVLALDDAARIHGCKTAADLSCGDGAILGHSRIAWEARYFGDMSARPGLDFTGPLEETVKQLPQVDLYLCSETVEHLRDPDAVLAAIRNTARVLILTTPCGENTPANPEHYWGWDTDGVQVMLAGAGWSRTQHRLFTPRSSGYYTFQIWMAW